MANHHNVLSMLFTLTGTFNVLVIKWSDNQLLEGNDGKLHRFQHPVFLTLLMFLGELLCFACYKIYSLLLSRRGMGAEDTHPLTRGHREFQPLIMLLPTALDAVASILLFTGLYLTYASSFQMIRGVALIFMGFFSSIYLNQTLGARHWMAIITMCWGIIGIISTDMQRVNYDQETLPHVDQNTILTGELLIIIAELLHAFQYVYEEKHLKDLDLVPMQVTGWQGIFGIIITLLLAVCLHFVPSVTPFNESTRGVFDDFTDLAPQLRNNTWLCIALGSFVISCAAYNFLGMVLTKLSSSVTRLMCDGLRIYFIFIFVIFSEWEYLNLLTIIFFVIHQIGAVWYRQAIFLEWYRSTLALWQRLRYVDLSAESTPMPSTQPADVI